MLHELSAFSLVWQPFYPSCHKLLYRTSTQPIWYLTIGFCELSQTHVCPAFPSPCLSVRQGLMHSRLPFMQLRMTFTPDFCLHIPNARIKGILPNLLLLLLLIFQRPGLCLSSPLSSMHPELHSRCWVESWWFKCHRDAAIQSHLVKWMSPEFPFFDPPFETRFPNRVSSQVLCAHSLPRSVKTSLKYQSVNICSPRNLISMHRWKRDWPAVCGFANLGLHMAMSELLYSSGKVWTWRKD